MLKNNSKSMDNIMMHVCKVVQIWFVMHARNLKSQGYGDRSQGICSLSSLSTNMYQENIKQLKYSLKYAHQHEIGCLEEKLSLPKHRIFSQIHSHSRKSHRQLIRIQRKIKILCLDCGRKENTTLSYDLLHYIRQNVKSSIYIPVKQLALT